MSGCPRAGTTRGASGAARPPRARSMDSMPRRRGGAEAVDVHPETKLFGKGSRVSVFSYVYLIVFIVHTCAY